MGTPVLITRPGERAQALAEAIESKGFRTCLLYTSDAADDMQCVDLGGRRIIKKREDVVVEAVSPCLGSRASRAAVRVFSSRRRHTRCREVSWARRCV